jgi:transketolase
MLSNFDMRDSFLTALYDVAARDPSIVILSNDFGAPALDRFRLDFPAHFVNAAISEQNMISTAAGMAKGGKKVIVYSIATFVTMRAYEQIKIDLCVMNQPVTILAVGAGYAYSADGPTHHATEDIAIMRALSNMTIYSPSDSVMASALGRNFGAATGPTYIRLDRGKYPALRREDADFSTGLEVLCASRTSVAIVSTGIMVHRALEVAEDLAASGVEARVIDLYRLKPLDASALAKAIGSASAVVSLEEQTCNGGLGGIVAEAMADVNLIKPLKRIAIADSQLYAYGLRDRLHRDRGLDREGVTVAILSWLRDRNILQVRALEKTPAN